VPDQDPEVIYESLCRYLKDLGFDDIEVGHISNEGDLLPGLSDPESPFVQKVISALRDSTGKEPVITPSSGG